jgi:hypothetical protein
VQSTGSCALHFGFLKEACIPSLKSIRLKVTELCTGQALGDADADADNDAADKSNPYMSPFEGDTKILKEACIPSLKSIRLIVTELCSGQALGDADADNAAADHRRQK